MSRTLAQQFAERFDAACQYALLSRCGSEDWCTLQYLTQTTPAMTVLSVANDHVSRLAMLQALRGTPGACRVLPYVRLWYSTPSTYVWIDGNNCPHRVTQALLSRQTCSQGNGCLLSLTTLYIVAAPDRVRATPRLGMQQPLSRPDLTLSHQMAQPGADARLQRRGESRFWGHLWEQTLMCRLSSPQ